MGVFARIFGRSKATPETPDAEAQTGTAPEGAEAAETEPAAKEAVSAKAEGSAGDGPEEVSARSDVGTDDASEGSGIPKQQSAEEAADTAGEGART